MKPLLPFFQWCDDTWLSSWIRDSRVLFPIIETFHLFALTVLLGTTIVLSLRLFGVAFPRRPVPELARDLAPWTRWSIVIVLSTGALLFLSEALRCYSNVSFRVKMLFLFTALLFHFTFYRKVTRGAAPAASPGQLKLAGILSLILWFGVGLAGRGIGFFG